MNTSRNTTTAIEDERAARLTRRTALRLTCALGMSATSACGQPFGDLPTGPIAAGNVKDLPVGVLKVVQLVAVSRDERGIFAMSAVCTHAGCPTQPTGTGADLFCPCHGSLFDGAGNVVRGPARAPLPHYQVDVAADGSVTVQAGTGVSPDTRTLVP
jgi:Rieske Fe-S protein